MRTFRIESSRTDTKTMTYFIDAESETEAKAIWSSGDYESQDYSEDIGIEELQDIRETDPDGNELESN